MRGKIPNDICKEAQDWLREIIQDLEKQDGLNSLDDSALALLGRTYHTYLQATNYLLQSPDNYLIKSPRGETKAHPFVKIQLDAQIQIDKLMDKFGLNPKSRKEISKPKENNKKKSPIDEFIAGKKEVR